METIMNKRKLQSVLGYEVKDHVISGLLVGLIAIGIGFYLQVKYNKVDLIPEYLDTFKEAFLKKSLLGALLVFLIFNYMDKLYSSKGVILSVIICGIYILKLKFFG